jgi:hypothetical protein
MVEGTGVEDGRTFGDLDGHFNGGVFYRDVGCMIADDSIRTQFDGLDWIVFI